MQAAVNIASESEGYQNPTESLPEPPPPHCPNSPCKACDNCALLIGWWSRFRATVNDIILKSNIHKCSTNKNKDGSQNKACTYKGCLDNIWGKCKRFPRPIFAETEFDNETGGINVKKKESWLNTFTYVVTYLFRCNTDVTSLQSGTAIKGVLLYVSNYVTKPALKNHVIFDTVCSMFQRNTEMIAGDDSCKDKARKLMTKIINSLSAKMEMGSPMICMYLLGNPDHYTNQLFVPFYWQSFIYEARKPWNQKYLSSDSTKSDDTSSTSTCETEYEHPERVILFKCNGQVIGLSPVQDYMYRPAELHNMSLYDWISRYQHEK